MKAQIEITENKKHFRVVEIEITTVNHAEGLRCLQEAERKLYGGEFVYQICAPCKNCKLPQPFYDFFNGFYLLESEIWDNQTLTKYSRKVA
jgi:hypothetical protein